MSIHMLLEVLLGRKRTISCRALEGLDSLMLSKHVTPKIKRTRKAFFTIFVRSDIHTEFLMYLKDFLQLSISHNGRSVRI